MYELREAEHRRIELSLTYPSLLPAMALIAVSFHPSTAVDRVELFQVRSNHCSFRQAPLHPGSPGLAFLHAASCVCNSHQTFKHSSRLDHPPCKELSPYTTSAALQNCQQASKHCANSHGKRHLLSATYEVSAYAFDNWREGCSLCVSAASSSSSPCSFFSPRKKEYSPPPSSKSQFPSTSSSSSPSLSTAFFCNKGEHSPSLTLRSPTMFSSLSSSSSSHFFSSLWSFHARRISALSSPHLHDLFSKPRGVRLPTFRHSPRHSSRRYALNSSGFPELEGGLSGSPWVRPVATGDFDDDEDEDREIEELGELPPEEAEYQKLVRQTEAEEDAEAQEYLRLSNQMSKDLEGYSNDAVLEAKKTAASLILAGDRIEELIGTLAQEGKLNEVLLVTIRSRLDLARHDKERDATECLELLYRRIQTEIRKSKATPALRLLNDLLNLYDGGSERAWLRQAKLQMRAEFVPEDPSLMFFQPTQTFDPEMGDVSPQGSDNPSVYRVDFIREADELLSQVDPRGNGGRGGTDVQGGGNDAASVARRLQESERQRAIMQVRELRDAAIEMRW
eukprot:TRINITY_DN878_c0_g1_i1.p1 TRINITY_DN878_c0_g1~~TRINITY_DN878_c0_g1_i1.p1  ORF type:complete len:563 (+),score=93.00 TRINITY_DN878_c0_g1_i1:138-1826(+)